MFSIRIRSTLRNLGQRQTGTETFADESTLSPDAAKKLAFEYLDYIDELAKRRFPRDANLALEGTQFVLDSLEADDWRRIRCWRRNGDFRPFLATLSARLLTDFYRAKFGYIRKPRWLEETSDPLWHTAYELLIIERWKRHEAIEQLKLIQPSRGQWYIEEVVGTVLAKCQSRPELPDFDGEADFDELADNQSPSMPGETRDKELLEALLCALAGDSGSAIDARVAKLTANLKPYLKLSSEDSLLLKLYYLEELPMDTIKRRLHFEGDIYKRLKKVLAHVRQACHHAGFISLNDH